MQTKLVHVIWLIDEAIEFKEGLFLRGLQLVEKK
jgi:hypothetical protein